MRITSMILHIWLLQWASLCNAFLVEAQWFASGHSPKSEEYLKNGVISSGVNVVLVHIFFLLGQDITRETTDLIDSIPDIIFSSATILRLWDDLGSASVSRQQFLFVVFLFFSTEKANWSSCYSQYFCINANYPKKIRPTTLFFFGVFLVPCDLSGLDNQWPMVVDPRHNK